MRCELHSVPALDIISSVHFLMVKGNLPNCIGASYIENRFVDSKNGCRKKDLNKIWLNVTIVESLCKGSVIIACK